MPKLERPPTTRASINKNLNNINTLPNVNTLNNINTLPNVNTINNNNNNDNNNKTKQTKLKRKSTDDIKVVTKKRKSI
jgi:aspartyl/asparaginyl beta-hydroxylase (cupin superfamily)